MIYKNFYNKYKMSQEISVETKNIKDVEEENSPKSI